MSKQKLNVQYSSRELLNHVFRCRDCGSPLLMFGCNNGNCENSNNKNILKSTSTTMNKQIIPIRTLLSKMGYEEADKEELCLNISKNRTSHISELGEVEAIQLKSYLQGCVNAKFGIEKPMTNAEKCNVMRKKIISHAYTLGWVTGEGKCDYVALNSWMLKYSELHKPMNKYTIDELPRLITQFKKVTKN